MLRMLQQPTLNGELPAHQILCWHLFLWEPELTQKAEGIHVCTLVSKVLGTKLKSSGRRYKMVNFIKQRSFHSRMFKGRLLLHKVIQWLSRGKVLNRVFELKGVLLRQNKTRFCWMLWRWRMAAETSQCSTYSSVPVRYEENVFDVKEQVSWI